MKVGLALRHLPQGSVILAGAATAVAWVWVVVNYAAPFCVSGAGFDGARRTRRGATS
ncbi:hypothetical protein OG871_36815 [Kitasatospora sp. NBC_00374]|uniref:hypothetical protein n=1 Tax=Kitasatospora sp. NBC_00374 TaxID=2975964 RepID=UPI003253E533